MPIPKRRKDERADEFISRCMSDSKMMSEYKDKDQRYAICQTNLAVEKVSFDYDGVLSTLKGTDLAKKLLKQGIDVYIISARHLKAGILKKAKDLGIPTNRIYATGSNINKIEKVKSLGISVHYDNNKNVIDKLENVGKLFE